MAFRNTHYDCNNIVLLSSFHYLLYKNQWPTHFPLIMEKIRAQIGHKEQKEILHKLFDTFEGYFWINDLSVYMFYLFMNMWNKPVFYKQNLLLLFTTWYLSSLTNITNKKNRFSFNWNFNYIEYTISLNFYTDISRLFEKLRYQNDIFYLDNCMLTILQKLLFVTVG